MALNLGPTLEENKYNFLKTPEPIENKIVKQANLKTKSPLEKSIHVSFRINKHYFAHLIRFLKNSPLTYSLPKFITNLRQKTELCSVLLEMKDSNDNFFFTKGCHLPFLKEEGAISFWIQKNWGKFIKEESVNLEPPKGNFTSIKRCGITQALLPPSNYHLYKDFLLEHYNDLLKNYCTFEIFLKNLKTESDPNLVKQWLEHMQHGHCYRLISDPSKCFYTKFSAKNYLQKNAHLPNIIRKNHTYVPWNKIQNLPDQDLKLLIQNHFGQSNEILQETVDFFRKRLRYEGFHLYKIGIHKTLYFTAIKRRIRNENTYFCESIQKIIQYIESCKLVQKSDLLENFLKAHTDYNLQQLKCELSWLIQEGFITEFEDGSLYVSPQQMSYSILNLPKPTSANNDD